MKTGTLSKNIVFFSSKTSKRNNLKNQVNKLTAKIVVYCFEFSQIQRNNYRKVNRIWWNQNKAKNYMQKDLIRFAYRNRADGWSLKFKCIHYLVNVNSEKWANLFKWIKFILNEFSNELSSMTLLLKLRRIKWKIEVKNNCHAELFEKLRFIVLFASAKCQTIICRMFCNQLDMFRT